MVQTSKTSCFSVSEELSAIVRTANQSIKKQPCLWLIHGSGGLSSNDDIWVDTALAKGYTVIQVDSYSNRNVFKQHWDRPDEYRIPWDVRANDQLITHSFLQNHQNMIPFANIFNNIVVGFSDGATAGLLLQSVDKPDIWKANYCLYPALPKWFLDNMPSVRSDKVFLFVGELDNWTPAIGCQNLQAKIGCHLYIFPDTHHSFSKPGINQWHENTMRTRTDRGVFCQYNEQSTKKTMEIVFNEQFL